MRALRRKTPLEPGMDSPLSAAISARDQGVMAMVRNALERNDLALAYQPVVQGCAEGSVAFYEGLIRVMDDTGRIIPAGDFMGAVEDKELGRLIDCASLTLGLKTLAQQPQIRLSINMSARSIGYPRWMQILRRVTRKAPQVAERLILEITESSAMQMPELVGVFMEDFAEMGITFALDDFGAGYTAFRHLKEFYFDIIKIDGQFITGVAEDSNNQVLCQALMSVAEHFDMFTVAERVETAADADWLVANGIGALQGYRYGAPSLRPPWETDDIRAHG